MKRPEEIADEFQKAWNSHEMAALASLFCEDATFVNRFGHYVRGVQEIVSLHAPIHETIYSDSTMENEVISTIALGDDAAVVHCWSRLTVGKAHPAGPHAVDTVILTIQNGVPVVTDGPYAEAQEVLAGYWVVECESFDRATDIATQLSNCPGPEYVTASVIDVRPIAEGREELDI